MGCIPSKEKFASGTSTTIDSAPTDKTTATVTTEAIPDKIATKPPRKTSKKARLSTVERENPGPEIPIPQWPSLAERSLDNCLPVANDYVPVRGLRDRQSPPVGWSVFKNSRDRWKFIRSALLVLSGNGFHVITSNRIELFFPRVSFNQAIAYRASLAVMDECGLQIKHSIVSANWGADRRAAFIHLMFDVEQQLEVLLSSSLNHIPVLKNDGTIRPSRPKLLPRQSDASSTTTTSSRQITARRSLPHMSTTLPTFRGRVIGGVGYSPQFSPPAHGSSMVHQNRMFRPAISNFNTASRSSLVSLNSGQYSGIASFPNGPQAIKTPIYCNDYRYDWRKTSPMCSAQVHRLNQPILLPHKSKSSSDLLHNSSIRYKSLDPRLEEAAPAKAVLEYFARDALNEKAGEIFEGGGGKKGVSWAE